MTVDDLVRRGRGESQNHFDGYPSSRRVVGQILSEMADALAALQARAEAAEARVRELEARLAAEKHVFFENVRLPPDALKSV